MNEPTNRRQFIHKTALATSLLATVTGAYAEITRDLRA